MENSKRSASALEAGTLKTAILILTPLPGSDLAQTKKKAPAPEEPETPARAPRSTTGVGSAPELAVVGVVVEVVPRGVTVGANGQGVLDRLVLREHQLATTRGDDLALRDHEAAQIVAVHQLDDVRL